MPRIITPTPTATPIQSTLLDNNSQLTSSATLHESNVVNSAPSETALSQSTPSSTPTAPSPRIASTAPTTQPTPTPTPIPPTPQPKAEIPAVSTTPEGEGADGLDMPEWMIRQLQNQQVGGNIIEHAKQEFRIRKLQERQQNAMAAERARQEAAASDAQLRASLAAASMQPGSGVPPASEYKAGAQSQMTVGTPPAPQEPGFMGVINQLLQIGQQVLVNRQAPAAAPQGPSLAEQVGQRAIVAFTDQLAYQSGKATGMGLGKKYATLPPGSFNNDNPLDANFAEEFVQAAFAAQIQRERAKLDQLARERAMQSVGYTDHAVHE